MREEISYALPTRWLYQITDKIVDNGEKQVQQGIFTRIILELDTSLYRDALRSIIKAVYKSGNEKAAACLSEAIVRGFDYIETQKRHLKEYRSCNETSKISGG